MNKELNKVILFAYFDGTATPIQTKQIQGLLQEPEGREWFYNCLEEWETERLQYGADAHAAFQQFKAQIDQQETGVEATRPLRAAGWYQARSLRWLVAASLILVSLLAYWQRNVWLYRIYATHYGELRTIGLPDGSRVTLNAHSTLRLSRWTFGRTDREVWLTGEAEFSVRHLPDHQRFVVWTPDQLEITVLGTEFVVSTRQQGSRISLNSGRVAFRQTRRGVQPSIVMRPGDVATVSPNGAMQLRSNQAVNEYQAWKEHRLLFNRTPLPQVLSILEEHFGETVRLANTELANRQITGTFRAETAPSLLELITTLTRTQVVETDSGKVLVPIPF